MDHLMNLIEFGDSHSDKKDIQSYGSACPHGYFDKLEQVDND